MHSSDFVRPHTPIAADPAWAGVRDAGPLAVHHDAVQDAPLSMQGHASSHGARDHAASAADQPRRTWWQHTLRVARHAAIGLSMLAAVPLAIIGVWGDDIYRDTERSMSRIVEVERLRPAMLARDAAITPSEAGRLLHALHPMEPVKGLPMHPVPTVTARPWDAPGVDSGLFASLRTSGAEGAIASNIVRAAARGFSVAEMAYLQSVATAPYWNDLERVVRAPAVDVLGGRFVLPFGDDARAYAMPITKFADSKRVAYAGVARAAYYVATGDLHMAEQALKTVVSHGFLLIDNGPSTIDALIGRVVVNIGRDGLHQLYTLTGDTQGQQLAAPFSAQLPNTTGGVRVPNAQPVTMAQLIRDVENTSLPRTQRFESLHQLSYASCSSIRSVLTGPSADVRATFNTARRTLARFPAEQAYIDLMYSTVDQLTLNASSRSVPDRLIHAAATATSAVLGNPRVATCTQIVLANRPEN